MTYYLVKKTIKATDDNPNFAGETKTYFLGKAGRCFDNSDRYEFEEHGFKRRYDAERCIKADQQSDSERTYEYFWETTGREIVTMEIEEA